jgi:2'-5' RNA ligase
MAGRPESHGVGISLWLVPDEPVRESLAEIIDELAGRFDAPRFPPHVTLLHGLSVREGEAVRRGAEMSRALEPLRLRASRVEARPRFFRCLALRVEETLGLLTARAQAALTFAPSDDEAYEPHLSVLYGSLDATAQSAAADELRKHVPVAFGSSRLAVWRTTGPVAEWRKLGEFPFGLPTATG